MAADLTFICRCSGSVAKRCACQRQYDAILRDVSKMRRALMSCAEGAFIMEERDRLINIAKEALRTP